MQEILVAIAFYSVSYCITLKKHVGEDAATQTRRNNTRWKPVTSALDYQQVTHGRGFSMYSDQLAMCF